MKKIGLLCLVMVLALGAVGAGYAHWQEILYSDVTVFTGEVDMEFSPCSTEEFEDKEVATCDCFLHGPDGDSNGDDGPDYMEIIIDNGYPSYECYVYFDVSNIGSIPVKVEWIMEQGDPCLDVTQECVVEGQQIEPGQWVDCWYRIHVLQDCEELSTYFYMKDFKFTQWNLVP